jgi:exonuclease III
MCHSLTGRPLVISSLYKPEPSMPDSSSPTQAKTGDSLTGVPTPGAPTPDLDSSNTDSLRHLHPDERIYTFWDYFRQHWQKNSGLRIDHILLNAELSPRLKEAGVDAWVRGDEHASDHAPTWVTLSGPAMKAAGKARTQ